MTEVFFDMTGNEASDPDAQATVTDFLDYTEYLPSDLIRSLTLIRKLDESYLNSSSSVHNLTKVYGELPSIPASKRPETQNLRKQISLDLDHAINARESSYAEATRLYDVVDRHYNRLNSIIVKLNALPKPPSRDPTPAPIAQSPDAKRSRSGRKIEPEASGPRITLRLDAPRPAQDRSYKQRRVVVPGEVLPPYNPDSPPPSSEMDWGSPEATPMPGAANRARPEKKTSEPKPLKAIKLKLPKPPRMPGMGTNVHSAVAGISTSNALALLEAPPENAIPGTKHAPWMRLTEWEMAKLRKRMKKNAIWSPSETMIRRELADRGRGPDNYRAAKAKADAEGTEFVDDDNLAQSSANKILQPGEISAASLTVGETNLSNRGMKLNEAKKLKKESLAREQAMAAAAEAEQAAKRIGDIGSSFKSIFQLPMASNSSITIPTITTPPIPPPKPKEKERSPKKRKREEEQTVEQPNVEQSIEATPAVTKSAKKRKTATKSTPATTTTPIVHSPREPQAKEPAASPPTLPVESAKAASEQPPPILPKAESPPPPPEPVLAPSKSSTPLSSPAPSILSNHSSIAKAASAAPPPLKEPPTTRQRSAVPVPATKPASKLPTPTPATTRPSSRRRSLAAGPLEHAEPTTRESLRRASATPARHVSEAAPLSARQPPATAAGHRSKRPAPGAIVADTKDGGTAVSVGRRKGKPKRRATANTALQKEKRELAVAAGNVAVGEDIRVDEDGVVEVIDPNEPRYCLCGDVSFGTMVGCEGEDVSIESVLSSAARKSGSAACFPPRHLRC